MKKLILLFAVLGFMSACGTTDPNDDDTDDVTIEVVIDSITQDTIRIDTIK